MRILCVAACGLLLAFDVFQPGESFERFEVPPVHCDSRMTSCVGLSYTIRLNTDTCMTFLFPDVRRAEDGIDVPFIVREKGTPGRTGYEVSVETSWRFSGTIVVHVITKNGACLA